jgi:tRNA nucleotidyltransferase/poly(A) polymerase
MNLLEDLPNLQRRTIDVILDVSAAKGCHPYLVGGPVRDRLLERKSIDIDLTLEEGSSTLARALAKKINGRVRSFPQFLTYKVVAEGYPDIDIATSRKERYRKPGALPAVTAGRLKDDLIRRDFTINALALDLTTGVLHDPSGGVSDVEARLVRILHDRSFIDDPTRIFRAVRLASRLGFEIESHTRKLLQSAVEATALTTVSRERIWRELFLAMDEREAPAILTSLGSIGALDTLFGRRPSVDQEASFAEAQRLLEEDPSLDRAVLFTGLLLHGDASPVDFEGSGFSQKRARAVVEIANDTPHLEELLIRASDETEKFRIYRRISPEMLALLRTRLSVEDPSIQRFHEFERFVLPIRGNDLDVPPGPHVALALEKTRQAVFSGEIAADQARAYARDTARRLFQSLQETSGTAAEADQAFSPGDQQELRERNG